MKKYLFSMLAMATMLFAASCTQEDDFRGNDGNEVEALFTVELPAGVATRAAGDGGTVDKVKCVVYEFFGNEKEVLGELTKVVDITGKTATYNTRLIKGRAYRVVFFAYNEAANAYNLEDMEKIQVKSGQGSNKENRDAFTAYVDVTATESLNVIKKPVTLMRPFAQLNVGSTAEDTEAARKAAGVAAGEDVMSKSYIKVTGVYNTFDAFESKAVGETCEMAFAMNDVLAESLHVDDVDYTYAAMNYILAGEKTTTNVTFNWEDAEGNKNAEDVVWANVPLQRNYRTNILGSVLTNPAEFNITIDARFEGDHLIVDDVAAANAAFAKGQTNVKIAEVKENDEPLVLPETYDHVSIELPSTEYKIDIKYPADPAKMPKVVNITVPDGKNVAEVIVNAPESTVNIEGNVGDLTVFSAPNTAYIKAGAKVGTVTVGKGNVVIEAGALVTKVVRADGNEDKYTLLSLGKGVVAPELGDKIYVVESLNVLTFAEFKTALADAEYEWDGKGAIVLLLDSERNYQNNKTAQFFVGASNVNITDPVEKVKVSNVTFQFEDDATDNAYTSGELQVFAKTIGFTGCTFIGTAVSPWGKSNTENAETAEFVGCTWKKLSGRYGVHQNRASNLKVQDCTFETCERGIHTNSTTPAAITITGNTFTGIGAGYGAICLAENGNIGDAELEISGNTAKEQVFLRQLNKGVTLEQIAAIKENNVYATFYVEGSQEVVPVVKVNGVDYASFAQAAAAAKAGDEIMLLGDIEGDITVPAGVTLKGNGKEVQVLGAITAEGEITFGGVIKATNFGTKYTNTVVNIPAGASLQLTGTGRMVIGHGCTFNITGSIENAKTADKATLVPSLVMPGASFTGAGVTFNVTNAYISAPSSYCSSTKSASGTFDFNIENSIWESAGKLAFESQSTAATVNFELKNSVLTTGSHLVFGVSRGEVVIDNSLVNKGLSYQIENQSTMTIKNGSVVNGAVATSSNAKNPGTIIVENATYAVTGEFSGSDLGIGNIVFKKGANFAAGSITKANITIDAAGMTAGEVAISANLKDFAGELKVVNNEGLKAEIVDGKIVLVSIAAKIGNNYYGSFYDAVKVAIAGDEITLLNDADLAFTDNPMYNNVYASVINLNGNTLTIKEGDIRFNNTTIKDGNIVVQPGTYNGTAIFLMYDDNTLTFDNVKVVATGCSGTYVIGLENASNLVMNNSSLTIDNNSLVNLIAAVANNGSGSITLNGSEVVVKNINGRAFLGGKYEVKSSTVTCDYVKAGFYIRANQRLSIDAESTVTVRNLIDGYTNGIDLYGNAEYNVEDGATVNATVGRNE